MKYCKYCGQDRPLDCFDIRRASKDGLSFKCKPCAREYGREHYPLVADRFKKQASAWAAANPERRVEIRRASAGRHIEAKRIKNRAYAQRQRQENPDQVRLVGRLHANLRRERMLQVEGSATLAELSMLLERSAGICVYCGATADLTVDHFDPVARGGSGWADNLIPCCKPCNSSKNDREGAEWLHHRFGVVGLARAVMFLEQQPDWATRLEA